MTKQLPPLPDELVALVAEMKRNNDTHAEYRHARGALDAHGAYGLSRATSGLKWATWALVLLAAVELILAVVEHA